MKPVTTSVVGSENAPAEAEASEADKSLQHNDGGGGTRTPKRFLAPHFEGHTPDHGQTTPGHEAAQSPDGDDPDLAGRAPETTPDHAQPVSNPVSSERAPMLGTVRPLSPDLCPRTAFYHRPPRSGETWAALFVGDSAAVALAGRQLLDSLLAIEFAGAMFNDDADYFDACPNCAGAPTVGHYAHCELRDALDQALGVKSERVVHPAHAKAATDA